MGPDHGCPWPPVMTPLQMIDTSVVWVHQSTASTGIRPTMFAFMHIEISAIALLLAIGVLSYLLGYLCGQMQFHRSPQGELPQKKLGEDRSEKTWAPRAILPASSAVPIYEGRFQPCASQAFLYPRNQPDPKAATATTIVRLFNNIMGSD